MYVGKTGISIYKILLTLYLVKIFLLPTNYYYTINRKTKTVHLLFQIRIVSIIIIVYIPTKAKIYNIYKKVNI